MLKYFLLVICFLINNININGETKYTFPTQVAIDSMQMGYSLGSDGDFVVVGVPGGGTSQSGRIETWKWNPSFNRYDYVDFRHGNGGTQSNPTYTGAGSDQFGTSVGISGDWVIAGAPYADYGGISDSGIVGLFKMDANGNIASHPESSIVNPTPVSSERLGIYVSIGGNWAAAASSSSVKQIYLSELTGPTTWTQQQIIVSPNFISSLTIDTDKMAVGSGGGIVECYALNGGTWSSNQTIDLKTIKTTASSANSIKISGNWMIVGSINYDEEDGAGTYTNSGIAFIFKHNGVSWDFHSTLERSEFWQQSYYQDYKANNMNFGSSVYINGDYISIGEKNHKINPTTTAGTTWIAKIINDVVVPQYKSTALATGTGANLGFATAINSNGVYVVGAPLADDSGTDRGRVVSGIETTQSPTRSPTTPAPTPPTPAPTFECTLSTHCTSNEYCSPSFTCDQTACSDISDCLGLFQSGRVSYCNTVSGYCEDKYAGTCSTAEDCSIKVTQARKASTGIGSATLKVITNNNMAASRNATLETMSRIKTQVADPTKLVLLVSGTETKQFSNLDYNSDPNFLDKVKAARCQGAVSQCTATVAGTGNRRMLQADDVIITITYTFDETAYASTTGFDFNDPDFLQALADSLGVNTTDIDITGDSSGNVNIEVTLADEGDGIDPLDTDLIDQINTINSNLATIGGDLASELGLSAGDLQTQSVDLCGDRDCNSRGTCNESTGVCVCTDTDYWGINCETLVTCNNGTKASGSAYCVCEYPEYGLRCELTKDCSACF